LGAFRIIFADGCDGLGPGLGHEDDGATFVAERAADFRTEIFFILVGEKFVRVDEQQKRGRRLPHLRGVEKFQPMSAGAHWLAALDAVVDGAVRGVAKTALGSGSALRGLQNGFVRSYAALILVGAIALIGAIWVVVQ